jgi:CDP-glycerol glycerophosphotransferase (TagB/SpsB family)
MNTVFTKILKVYYILLSKLCGLFINNQDSEIILFGARDGQYYMDNSRALFEWYAKNNVSSTFYWMTVSPYVEKLLKSKQLPVVRIDSFQGACVLNKAKYAFYTNRLRDVAIDFRAVPSSLKMIFLSHGQSVKNTRLAVKVKVDSGFRKDSLKAAAQTMFAVSTSPFMAEVQAESNGLKSETYKLTGFPRNDWMFNPPEEAFQAWNKFTAGKKYKKVILYAPTWRRSEPKTKMFPFEDLDQQALAKFVTDNDILLLLRPHVQDLKNNYACSLVARQLVNLTPNIRLATINEFVEANFLLPFIDGLVTDYSSIYHDFLLLNRPIFFIPYDLATFDRLNGFKYPYLENLPGSVISSQSQMIMEFSNLLNNVDHYLGQRKKLSDLIYTFQDGFSSERLAKEIFKSNNES